GYARTAICAETGAAPARGCRAVVAEWLDAADRATLARRAPRASPTAALTIAFPHDGDRFALIPGGGAQRIAVALVPQSAAPAAIAVDGRRLPPPGGAGP